MTMTMIGPGDEFAQRPDRTLVAETSYLRIQNARSIFGVRFYPLKHVFETYAFHDPHGRSAMLAGFNSSDDVSENRDYLACLTRRPTRRLDGTIHLVVAIDSMIPSYSAFSWASTCTSRA